MISKLTPNQIDVVLNFLIETTRDAFGALGTEKQLESYLTNHYRNRDRWERFLSSNEAAMFGHLDHEKILSLISVDARANPRLPHRCAYVGSIRVLNKRDGIGSILFGKAREWAVHSGCDSMFCEVAVENVPATQFFLKHGFEVDLIRTGKTFGDALWQEMSLSLTSP